MRRVRKRFRFSVAQVLWWCGPVEKGVEFEMSAEAREPRVKKGVRVRRVDMKWQFGSWLTKARRNPAAAWADDW
jgi:hypothetical protein